MVAWLVALNRTETFNDLLDYDLMCKSLTIGMDDKCLLLYLPVLDIRGTYGSNPLNLSSEGFHAIDKLLQTMLVLQPKPLRRLKTLTICPTRSPTTEAEFNSAREYSAAFFQSWIDSSTPPGIVNYVSTKEAVQDYNQIRKALGYQKIHFVGSS